jgi:predicted small lipoprotein YifL
MRNALAAAMLALATLSLTACGGGSPDDAASTGVETNTYRGIEDLACIEDGAGNTKVRTCDYAAFYAEHPALLAESIDDADTEGVWWTTYLDEPMPCYREGKGNMATLSCDYEWFYSLNPDLRG